MNARRGVGLAIAAALLLVAGRLGAGWYSDYLWYAALDATDAWQLRTLNSAVLRLVAFMAGAGLAFANLWAIRRSVASVVLPRQLGNIEIGEEVPSHFLFTGALAGAVLLGVLFAIPATDWMSFALAQAGVPFGETDPYFQTDLGAWIFWLPFERAVHRWLWMVVASLSVVVVSLYALTPSLRWARGRLLVSAWVRRHVATLAAVALVLVAWSFRLEGFDLLLHGSAPGGAFGAADQQFGLPVATALAYASIAAAFVVGWAGWSGQPRLAVAVLTIILLLTPMLRWVVPSVIRLTAGPVDPIERERPYEAVRAGFTRRAFGLDRIRPLPDSLAAATLIDVAPVPVWDPAVLSRFISRTRQHGGLVGAMPVVVSTAGPLLVTVMAPASGEDTGPDDDGWKIFRTLAATTDARGGLLQVDALGRFPETDESVGEAVVWDGARGTVVVHDSTGTVAGAPLDKGLVRLAEAWSRQDLRLLGASAPGRVLVRRRDVRERVRALVPFLLQGTTVVPVVDGDSLVWTLELFSASAHFPLARPLSTGDGPVRYLAHAATAFVSARTGRVTIVPVGATEADPVLRTWLRKLPRTLGLGRTVAPSLAAQLPPVVSGAEWQAEVFAAVGLRGESGRRRHIPALDGSDTVVASRHNTPLWWPGLDAGAWTLPLVEADDLLSGALVAVGGRNRALYWHAAPADHGTWTALLDSLGAAGGRGADIVSGRVRVVPMGGGDLALVQPFYRWPREGVPQVQSVVVRHGGAYRVGGSLAAAVGAPAPPGPLPASPSDVTEHARALHAAMRAALQRGDWIAFGEAFESLGALLERPRR